jgi:hypothetical protein
MFKLLKMELALLLSAFKLASMELLQTSIFFNSFMQGGLILGCDVYDLLIKSVYFNLAEYKLLFKGPRRILLSFSFILGHRDDPCRLLGMCSRLEKLDRTLSEEFKLALEGLFFQRRKLLIC